MKEQQEINHATTNREGDTVVYDVSVTRHVWEKAKEPVAGLRDKIRNARTVAEVNALLEKGTSTYKEASAGTIGKWKRAAERRIRELENPVKVDPRAGHTPLEAVVEKPKKRYSKKY